LAFLTLKDLVEKEPKTERRRKDESEGQQDESVILWNQGKKEGFKEVIRS
jgi:hypothetical protein